MIPINAKTQVTGLLGYPVEHSLSPEMHNSAFASLKIDYCYLAFPVHPDSLTRAIEGIRAMNFRGVNITVPHKEKVLMMLDTVDEEADFIRAVNTIVNNDGYLKGYNTDGRGFMHSLKENDIEVSGMKIFVSGAGGASRAVSYYLSKAASRLYLYDIDAQKAGALVQDLEEIADTVFLSEGKDEIYTADMVINATPLGLKPDDPLPFGIDEISPHQIIVDLIYRDTPLLHSVRQKGCKALNGLGMLLWQGALAFELWTGLQPPVEIMRNALTEGFSRKEQH